MEILARGIQLSRSWFYWVTLILILAVPLAASGQGVDEYEIKAAFLYNFTRFVEWPADAAANAFSICILGDDPFGPILDQAVRGKTVSGHFLQVRRLQDASEARQCQVVFVRGSEEAKAARLVEAVRGLPVLTVGERNSFSRTGGMIYLTMKDNRMVVVINTAVTDKVGLKISAKLMSVAKKFTENEIGENHP